MDIKILTPRFAVGPQIGLDDLRTLVDHGYRSVICNRPDGEGADHPSFAEIETACRDAGLQAAYLPVVPGKVSDADATAFGTILESLPEPTFAFCRTGARAATLWALSEADRGRQLADILTATKGAGYDLTDTVRRVAAGGHTPTDAA
jgi:sulfide:quinone oxidoreductase